MHKITYKELWNNWITSSLDHPLLLASKEGLSKYSEDDWDIISADAEHLKQILAELVLYDIPLDSKVAELLFDNFIEHFNKWFFPVNQRFLFVFSRVCVNDYKYFVFFDEPYNGIAEYLSKLLRVHLYKVPEFL